MRTTRSSPRAVGSSLRTPVSWVMVNTKTRSKKSSRVETRSTRWAGWGPSDPRLGPEAGGGVPFAEVAGQDGRPGGAGVALGQQGAADPRVVHQGRPVHAVDGDRALHVAELAHVV